MCSTSQARRKSRNTSRIMAKSMAVDMAKQWALPSGPINRFSGDVEGQVSYRPSTSTSQSARNLAASCSKGYAVSRKNASSSV